MKFFNLLFIIIGLNFGLRLSGQDTIPKLGLIAKVYNDGIKLRWGVNDAYLWQRALNEGYILERAIFDPSKSFDEQKFINLPNYPIVKWTDKQWNTFLNNHTEEKKFEDSLKYAMISKSLTDELFYLKGDESFEQVLDFNKKFKTKFAYAMIAADQSWYAALSQGLGYKDVDVKESETYIYKVTLNFKSRFNELEPAYFKIVNKMESKINQRNVNLLEIDQEIIISFKNDKSSSGYFVEISEDSINFVRIGNEPFFTLKTTKKEMIDSIKHSIDSLVNNKLYFFRVKGISPFGEVILIGEAKGIPRDLTPPGRPSVIGAFHNEPDIATIKWNMLDPISSDLNGFIIGRSNEENGVYNKIHDGIIPKNVRSFEDKYFNREGPNYYIIEAVDSSGNGSMSNCIYLTLIDSTPPKIPICNKSKMDSLGIVTLQLEPHKEKDFMGYRIYKANAADHEFSVVQETYNDTIVEVARKPIIIDTSTVKSLTKYIYYKVTALDYHYNESKPSEIIKVKRPDIYPPVAPMINDFLVTDSLIRIDFIRSTSSDVVKHYMMRKKSSEENWATLDTLGVNQTSYYDKSCITGISYDYALIAQDDSDLISPISNVVTLKTYRKSRPVKIDITCVYDTNSKTTTITWILKEKIQDMTQLQIYDVSKNATYINTLSAENEGKYVFPSPQMINKVGLKLLTSDFDFLISKSNACKIIK